MQSNENKSFSKKLTRRSSKSIYQIKAGETGKNSSNNITRRRGIPNFMKMIQNKDLTENQVNNVFQSIKNKQKEKLQEEFSKKRFEILFKFIFYIFSNIINIIAIINYMLQTFFDEDNPEYSSINLVLSYIELSLTFYFLLEYVLICIRIKNGILKHLINIDSVIDLVSIVPSIIIYFISFKGVKLSFIRIFRIFRVFRVLRIYKSLRKIQNENADNHTENGPSNKAINIDPIKLQFFTIVVILVCVFFIGAGLVLGINDLIENAFSKTKFNFFDAIYFMIVTYCTLGYGDITPTNQITRFLIILGLFSLIIIVSDQFTKLANLLKFWGPGIKAYKGHNHLILIIDKSINIEAVLNFLASNISVKRDFIIITKDAISFNYTFYPFNKTNVIITNNIDLELLDLINFKSAAGLFIYSTKKLNNYDQYDKITDFILMKLTQSYFQTNIYVQSLNTEKTLLNVVSQNKKHSVSFQNLRKVVPVWKVKSSILAKTTFNPGFPTFMQNLLFNVKVKPDNILEYSDIVQHYICGAQNKIYVWKLSEFFYGKDFYDAMYIIYFRSISEYFYKIKTEKNISPILLIGILEKNILNQYNEEDIEIFPMEYKITQSSFGIFITYDEKNRLENILKEFDISEEYPTKLATTGAVLNKNKKINTPAQALFDFYSNINDKKVEDSDQKSSNSSANLSKESSSGYSESDYSSSPKSHSYSAHSNEFEQSHKDIDNQSNKSNEANTIKHTYKKKTSHKVIFESFKKSQRQNSLSYEKNEKNFDAGSNNILLDETKGIKESLNQKLDKSKILAMSPRKNPMLKSFPENEAMTYSPTTRKITIRKKSLSQEELIIQENQNKKKEKNISSLLNSNIDISNNKNINSKNKMNNNINVEMNININNQDKFFTNNNLNINLNLNTFVNNKIFDMKKNSSRNYELKGNSNNNSKNNTLNNSIHSSSILLKKQDSSNLNNSSLTLYKRKSQTSNNDYQNINESNFSSDSLNEEKKKNKIKDSNKLFCQETNTNKSIKLNPRDLININPSLSFKQTNLDPRVSTQIETDVFKIDENDLTSNKNCSFQNKIHINDDVLILYDNKRSFKILDQMKESKNEKVNKNKNLIINQDSILNRTSIFQRRSNMRKSDKRPQLNMKLLLDSDAIIGSKRMSKLTEKKESPTNRLTKLNLEVERKSIFSKKNSFSPINKSSNPKRSKEENELTNYLNISLNKNKNKKSIRSSLMNHNFKGMFEIANSRVNGYNNKNTALNLEMLNKIENETIFHFSNESLNDLANKLYYGGIDEEKDKGVGVEGIIDHKVLDIDKTNYSSFMKDHIIIVGYQDNLYKLLKLLFGHHKKEICLFTRLEFQDPKIMKLLKQYQNLFYFKGKADNPIHLINAGLNNAYMVLFITEKINPKTNEDMDNVLIYKTIDYFFDTKMLFELWDVKNTKFIGYMPLVDEGKTETNEFLHPCYMAGRMIYTQHLDNILSNSYLNETGTTTWLKILNFGLVVKSKKKRNKIKDGKNYNTKGSPVILTIDIPDQYNEKEYYFLVDDLMRLDPPALVLGIYVTQPLDYFFIKSLGKIKKTTNKTGEDLDILTSHKKKLVNLIEINKNDQGYQSKLKIMKDISFNNKVVLDCLELNKNFMPMFITNPSPDFIISPNCKIMILYFLNSEKVENTHLSGTVKRETKTENQKNIGLPKIKKSDENISSNIKKNLQKEFIRKNSNKDEYKIRKDLLKNKQQKILTYYDLLKKKIMDSLNDKYVNLEKNISIV